MMKAGLRPELSMETVICDSELSQLSFSTTSAHSSNAQPSSKEKKSSSGGRKKGKAQKNIAGRNVAPNWARMVFMR